MDTLIAEFGKVLTGLGITGLFIAVSLFLNYWLLNKWQESQEARITEGKEAVKALSTVKDSMDRLVEVIKAGKA